MISTKKKTYKISANLSTYEIDNIKSYIKGAVNTYCTNFPENSFSVQCLFGGDNRDWNDTPLQKVYDYYISIGKSHDEASKAAAQDVGRLLRETLSEDNRYEYYDLNENQTERTNKYKRI